MELILERERSAADSTIGRLFIDGAPECFTLEDVVRAGNKVLRETAIPPGRYRVEITKSQRFGRMLPLLLDVPGFEGIRIHPGNVAADTSGCILVGQGHGLRSVVGSRLAMAALQPKIAGAIARGDQVWIDVRNEPGT